MADHIIDAANIGDAIVELLRDYCDEKVSAINDVGEKSVKKLVRLTKKTAPKDSGKFSRSITYAVTEDPITGDKTFIWGAKSPHHRITHLAVNGREGENGRRIPGNPFLKNALDQVVPEYEKEVEGVFKE